jgi:superfamily II DNA or RNA helicase
MIELYDYQAEKVDEVFDLIAAGHRRILVVSPTGSGKTVIASEIIRRLNIERKEVLFIDHLREITKQTSGKLNEFDVFNGIIQAKIRATPIAGVQVASIQTLFSRSVRGQQELPPARVIFIDEAHHSVARTYRRLLEKYPDAIIIGLTATPCRGDGRGLGGVFEVMVLCPDVPDLIEKGRLVPSRVYAPEAPDLHGVQVQRGDYVIAQLALRMDTPKLVADILSTWFKYGENRQTVVYASGVGHSVHIRDEFIQAGITCEHIDGKTPIEEREAALARFASKQVRILTNFGVFTEGWDCPDIGAIILARPTKSFGLLLQMLGRGRRIAPGKKDLIVLDHTGAFPKVGMPDDRIEWTLDPEKKAHRNRNEEKRRNQTSPKIRECSQCGTLCEAGKACPHCGFLPAPKPKIVVPHDGELVEIKGGKPTRTIVDKQQWYDMIAGYAAERGRKPGYAYFKFQERFGHKPPWDLKPKPCEPSAEVRAWCRSRDIAYAKAMQKAQAGP